MFAYNTVGSCFELSLDFFSFKRHIKWINSKIADTRQLLFFSYTDLII